MSTSPHQLFLLADHVKLSLLERQRAVALNLEPTKQDGHITRSLETIRDGIENLHKQIRQLSSTSDDTTDLRDQTARLQEQYSELSLQFHGPSAAITFPSLTTPNDPSLSADFAHATRAKPPRAGGAGGGGGGGGGGGRGAAKNVRFRDDPDAPDDELDENRSALFNNGNNNIARYTDDPNTSEEQDQSGLSNQQIHAYHKQVLSDQDAQLDTLGQSISRQRTLGIAMGEELDDHNVLLQDVESGVDRHQSTLDRAQGRLKKVARGARENGSWVLIGCLMLILILLIALT